MSNTVEAQVTPDPGSDAAALQFITHGTRQYARRISRKEWNRVKPTLFHLNQQGHTRARMIAVLKEQYDFEPSSNQLYNKMNEWGYKPLFKNSQDATIDPTVAVTAVHDATASRVQSHSSSSSFSTQQEHADASMPELVSDTTSTSATSADDNAGYSSLGEDFTQLYANTANLPEFEMYDVLNDVAYFLQAANSFSEAFNLFSRCSGFLSTTSDVKPSTIAFAEINRLRTATLKSEQRLATDISLRAANQIDRLSADSEFGHATQSWLHKLSKGLCGASSSPSPHRSYPPFPRDDVGCSSPSKLSCGEIASDTLIQDHLVRWCDPFLLARRQTWFLSQWMATYQQDAYVVGTMIDWCAMVLLDSDYDEDLGPYCFNPRDQHSRSNYATILACYLLRRWMRQTPDEILARWCPIYPPGQQNVAIIISSKVCVQVIFTLCHLIVDRASQGWTGYRVTTYGEVPIAGSLNLDQMLLHAHFNALSAMPAHIRFREFARAHDNLSTRDIDFRRQMHKSLMTKDDGQLQLMVVQHVRETANTLAKFAIELRRAVGHGVTIDSQQETPNVDVPHATAPTSRPPTPSDTDSERQSIKSDDMNRFRRFAKHVARLSNTKYHNHKAGQNTVGADSDCEYASEDEYERTRQNAGINTATRTITSKNNKPKSKTKSMKKSNHQSWKFSGVRGTPPSIAGFGFNSHLRSGAGGLLLEPEPAVLPHANVVGFGYDFDHDIDIDIDININIDRGYDYDHDHEFEYGYEHEYAHEYEYDFDSMMIDA